MAQSNAALQIPALCYHNILPNAAGHSPAFTISLEQFRQHMKMLHDSGYHSILPAELYAHFTRGASLPPKPVLISFDDSHDTHYSEAFPLLNSYHFKAVFFIMTVTINKPRYMSADQIRIIADSGHCIALHTWDHPDMRKLKGNDWVAQVDRPKQQLERITGRTVLYFAYPFGAWNEEAARQLQNHGILAAFQLSGQRSLTHPLYTIRRLQVAGSWSAKQLSAFINTSFR